MRHLVSAALCFSATLFFALACSNSHGPDEDAGDRDGGIGCGLRPPYWCVNVPEPHVCGSERTTAACRAGEWLCPIGTLPNTSDDCWCQESERPGDRYMCTPEGWRPNPDETCPADPTSAAGRACATEGRYCTYGCEPCSFCNLLSCEGGVWTRLEAPPPPCIDFECGPDLVCNSSTEYCVHSYSDTGEPDSFVCTEYPSGCMSCDCLGGNRCTGTQDTGITVEWFGG